jgi:hypothetical protein
MSWYDRHEDDLYRAVFVLVIMVVLIFGGALVTGIIQIIKNSFS